MSSNTTSTTTPPVGRTLLSFSDFFPFIIGTSSASVCLQIVNIALSFLHLRTVGRPNLYNIALCVCSIVLLIHFAIFLGQVVYMNQHIRAKTVPSDFYTTLNIFTVSRRVSYSIFSLLYLIIVESRFSIVIRNIKLNKVLLYSLIAVTVIFWLPHGVGFTGMILFNRDLMNNNPKIHLAMQYYDVFWDTFFVAVDLLLGTLTLRCILKFSDVLKQISKKQRGKEAQILFTLTRNVAIWMGVSVFWIAVVYLNMVKWGPANNIVVFVNLTLTGLLNFLNSLQFSFAILWLKNLKTLLESGNRIRGGKSTSGNSNHQVSQSTTSHSKPKSN